MITKYKRPEDESRYNLRVTDKYNRRFDMWVAGNHDLYWVPELNKNQDYSFVIDKDDEFLYGVLNKLFNDIKKNDNPYRPSLIGNTFNFISEDFHEDFANKLTIEKGENDFTLNFIRHKESYMGIPRRGCVICFCNSGSRVPKIETLFMQMFSELAYYTEVVEEQVR